MSRIATLTAEVIDWLAEVGVQEADETTVVSSLDLTWILHRFEESTGRTCLLSDEELREVTHVSGVVGVLDRHGRIGGKNG